MMKYLKIIFVICVLTVAVCLGTAFYRQPGYLLSWFDQGTGPGKSIEDIFASALIDASAPESVGAAGKEGLGRVNARVPGAGDEGFREDLPQRTSGDKGTTADRYPRLAAVMVNFEAPPTGKELEAWRNNSVHQSWLLVVEDRIGESLKDETMERIALQHIQMLYVHDRLVEKCNLEEISWNDWIAACAELTQWSDEVCRRELTDGEYKKLWGYGKNDPVAGENIEALWTPPDSAEVFVLFPQIKEHDPSIRTEQDLYGKIAREKVDRAVSLYKKMLYDQQMVGRDFNMGKMGTSEMVSLENESYKFYQARMTELLSADEYRYFFSECEGCPEPWNK